MPLCSEGRSVLILVETRCLASKAGNVDGGLAATVVHPAFLPDLGGFPLRFRSNTSNSKHGVRPRAASPLPTSPMVFVKGVDMSWAKAARDWKSFERIGAALQRLEEYQTLVMQSGKPVGIFPSQATTPLVLMANGNVVGAWADDDGYRALEAKGLTIMPGMTAAAWQYIGSQGILQGTYETFSAAARRSFSGSLAGRLIVTGGCGGMSGAQPLAGQLAGAATLVVEVDPDRIRRRVSTGYCQRMTSEFEEALRWCIDAVEARCGVSVGFVGNIATVLGELVARGITPDIVTDQTICDPVNGYVPEGMNVAQARAAGNGRQRTQAAIARDNRKTRSCDARVERARIAGI
jgi:urocanate hydratase